jgi:hypothetical protein
MDRMNADGPSAGSRRQHNQTRKHEITKEETAKIRMKITAGAAAEYRKRPPTIAADHCGSGARPTRMNADWGVGGMQSAQCKMQNEFQWTQI